MWLGNETFNYTRKNQNVENELCFVNDSTMVKLARIFSYCILLVVSLLGNSATVAVVWKEQRMRKTVNFFIVNMCVADLLITLYMPRSMSVWYDGYQWQLYGKLGSVLCKLAVFAYKTAVCVSVFTVVAISFDRFCAVVFPLKTVITKKVCRMIIAMIWFVAVLVHLPVLFGLKVLYRNGRFGCYLSLGDLFYEGAAKDYFSFTLIGLFAVPLSVIVVLYSAILIFLKLRTLPGEERAGREQRRDALIKKRVLRMVLIVVAVFVICRLLFFLQGVLSSYKVPVGCEVLFLRMLSADLNSAVNPCLYLLLNENFRKGLKRIVIGCALCRRILSEGNSTQRVSPRTQCLRVKLHRNADEQN